MYADSFEFQLFFGLQSKGEKKASTFNEDALKAAKEKKAKQAKAEAEAAAAAKAGSEKKDSPSPSVTAPVDKAKQAAEMATAAALATITGGKLLCVQLFIDLCCVHALTVGFTQL